MRMFEECPYITPCGWCSRQNKQCEKKKEKDKKAGVENGKQRNT